MYYLKQDKNGNLGYINFSDLPFIPQRLFIINDVPKGQKRGDHAHKNTDQYLVCLDGQIDVEYEFLYACKNIILKEGQSLYLPAMIWSTQTYYYNASLLVFCSTTFEEDIYIRDKKEWIKMLKS